MKKLLSYLFPITLKKVNSEINGKLEVNLINGKKTLDTPTSNYSYGALQKVLHKGLSIIKFDSNVKKVLVLGLGAGSIIDTIRNDFKSAAYIELIENDPEVIKIAKDEFGINRFENINIINADAYDYVRTSSGKFEVIIVDIFIGNIIPQKFTTPEFIHDLASILEPNGKIIYNSMRSTMKKGNLDQLKSNFEQGDLMTTIHEHIESTNNLLVIDKKQAK